MSYFKAKMHQIRFRSFQREMGESRFLVLRGMDGPVEVKRQNSVTEIISEINELWTYQAAACM